MAPSVFDMRAGFVITGSLIDNIPKEIKALLSLVSLLMVLEFGTNLVLSWCHGASRGQRREKIAGYQDVSLT
jgi:hypothetical protein